MLYDFFEAKQMLCFSNFSLHHEGFSLALKYNKEIKLFKTLNFKNKKEPFSDFDREKAFIFDWDRKITSRSSIG